VKWRRRRKGEQSPEVLKKGAITDGGWQDQAGKKREDRISIHPLNLILLTAGRNELKGEIKEILFKATPVRKGYKRTEEFRRKEGHRKSGGAVRIFRFGKLILLHLF